MQRTRVPARKQESGFHFPLCSGAQWAWGARTCRARSTVEQTFRQHGSASRDQGCRSRYTIGCATTLSTRPGAMDHSPNLTKFVSSASRHGGGLGRVHPHDRVPGIPLSYRTGCTRRHGGKRGPPTGCALLVLLLLTRDSDRLAARWTPYPLAISLD